MNGPLISVVMPTYNSVAFIQESLSLALQQTYNNFEIIVSDDGSTDNTKCIVKELFESHKDIRAKLLENEHRGPGFARNQGILNSAGTWIAFLDSDDLWCKDKLSRVVEYIQENQEVDLWCHSEIVRTKDGEMLIEHYMRFNQKMDPFLSMYRDNSLSTSAITVKKESLFKSGLFDESLPNAQDYDLWLRLSNTARLGFIKEALGIYVTREDSITSYDKRRLRCLMEIAKKYHNILKKKTRLYFIEEAKFKGRVYIDAGLGLIYRKRKMQGLFFLSKGIMYWPFRKFSIKSNIKKLLK